MNQQDMVQVVHDRGAGVIRCIMHNSWVHIPAKYLMLLPIGNEIPLCTECCAWWRKEAFNRPEDAMTQPVSIRDIPKED